MCLKSILTKLFKQGGEIVAANSSIQQHEPLRVPSNWGTNEKRLIAQLEELFDDIYSRFNRLGLTDLSKSLRKSIMDAFGNVSTLQQTATEIAATVSDAVGDISTLQQTATEIKLMVGTQRVYLAATESDLLIQLAAESPVVPMAVSLLWYDTTNKLFKRCTALGPPIVWETLQTNEVHTSYIDLAGNKLDIGSTGEINLAAGGNINIKSGANLKIESGGDLNIASGGALNVTAPTTLNITAGSGDSAVGIKNDTYFLYAGNATPASAPFSVGMDGTLKATKLSAISGTFTNLYATFASGKRIEIGQRTIGTEPYTGLFWSTGDDLYIAENSSGTFILKNINAGFNFAASTPVIIEDYLWVGGNVSAASFTDRTPSFSGDALSELALVKNDKTGNIDHSTLPEAARKKIKRQTRDAKGKVDIVEEDGRDIGMMISIQTKAIQQLRDITTAQQQQIDELTKSVQQLKDTVTAQQKQIAALSKVSKK